MARSLNDVFLTFRITDVSTASQIYIPVPEDGHIVEIGTALNGAIATADADITAKIGGTAVTGGVITITASGSTYGDVDVVYPTAANEVSIGDSIEIETDGASTNTISINGYVVIRR